MFENRSFEIVFHPSAIDVNSARCRRHFSVHQVIFMNCNLHEMVNLMKILFEAIASHRNLHCKIVYCWMHYWNFNLCYSSAKCVVLVVVVIFGIVILVVVVVIMATLYCINCKHLHKSNQNRYRTESVHLEKMANVFADVFVLVYACVKMVLIGCIQAF